MRCGPRIDRPRRGRRRTHSSGSERSGRSGSRRCGSRPRHGRRAEMSTTRPSSVGRRPASPRGVTSLICGGIAAAEMRRPVAHSALGGPTAAHHIPSRGTRPRSGEARRSGPKLRPRPRTRRDQRSPSACVGHLKHHKHCPKFWKLIDIHAGDWRKAKDHLDGLVEILLN